MILQKFKIFSEKSNELYQKTQYLNILRVFSFLVVAFYSKPATFRFLKKIKTFSEKAFFSEKNAKICTFWGFSIYQSHSTANLRLLEILKYWRLFFEKSVFFLGKPHFSNFSRKLTISIAFYRKMHNFSDFKKLKIFFSENI